MSTQMTHPNTIAHMIGNLVVVGAIVEVTIYNRRDLGRHICS